MTTDSLIESERVKASLALRAQRLMPADRRAELILGGSFLAASLALLLLSGEARQVTLFPSLLYVLAMAAASQMYFRIGSGFTVPTQLVFVPLLFAEPPAAAPLLVAVSVALGMVLPILRGDVKPSRLLNALGNSWFALGPAVVLSLGHFDARAPQPTILIGALIAQFACDFAGNVASEHLHRRLAIRDLAGEMWRVYVMDASLAPVGLAVAFAATHHPWAPLLVAPLFGLMSVFSKERQDRLTQLIELNDAYRGTALVLGDVVEADDSYTGEHTRGVVQLTLDVAEQLGLNAHQRRNVEFGALLHDVGKVAVPKSIINKPGKLNAEEWEIIKQHTIEGQRMLETVGGFMKEVGLIVRSSHERWDGGGYPDGLVGEAIPLESRICSVCDAFNAMTTTRSYRAAMPIAEAVAELKRCAGAQFDPSVVEALLAVVGVAAAVEVPAVVEVSFPAPRSRVTAEIAVGDTTAPGAVLVRAG